MSLVVVDCGCDCLNVWIAMNAKVPVEERYMWRKIWKRDEYKRPLDPSFA